MPAWRSKEDSEEREVILRIPERLAKLEERMASTAEIIKALQGRDTQIADRFDSIAQKFTDQLNTQREALLKIVETNTFDSQKREDELRTQIKVLQEDAIKKSDLKWLNRSMALVTTTIITLIVTMVMNGMAERLGWLKSQ